MSENTRQAKNKYVILGIVCVAIIVVVTLAASYTAAVTARDTILDGVYSGKIDLSGLTMTQAQETLAENAAPMRDTIDFVCDDITFTLTSNQIGLEADYEASAKQACEYGRNGNILKRTEAVLYAKFRKKYFEQVYKCDENLLLAAIADNIGDKIVSVTPYKAEIGDNCLLVTNAVGGIEIDKNGLAESVIGYATSQSELPVNITLCDIAPPDIDIDEFCTEYLREAADATYSEIDGGYVFTPEVIGISFDKNEAESIIEKNKGNAEPYIIPAVITQPQVTVAQLEEKFVSKVIAQYSTNYASSDANRASNVALAASKIDGVVLNPGERFSFNSVVGPRTAATGFKIAHVYEGDRVVDGMGGGICQVSSTLYNAVVLADLKIVYRTNHSMPVGYVPLGRDATVSYGTIDFVFENNKTHPIKISAVTKNRNLTVSVMGAASDRTDVSIVTENAGYTPFATKEIPDDTLKVGEKKIVKNGTNGAIVNSYKVYKTNGVVTDKVFLAKSTYVAVAREIRVGTAPVYDSAPVHGDTEQTNENETTQTGQTADDENEQTESDHAEQAVDDAQQ